MHYRKELERAVKKRMKYAFSHYLMISKSYRLPDVATKKKKKQQQQDQAGPRMFVNTEEEYFFDVSN